MALRLRKAVIYIYKLRFASWVPSYPVIPILFFDRLLFPVHVRAPLNRARPMGGGAGGSDCVRLIVGVTPNSVAWRPRA